MTEARKGSPVIYRDCRLASHQCSPTYALTHGWVAPPNKIPWSNHTCYHGAGTTVTEPMQNRPRNRNFADPRSSKAKIGRILRPGMAGLSAGVRRRIKLPTSGGGMKLDMERSTTDTRRCLDHCKQGIEHQNHEFQSRQAPSMGGYLKWIVCRRSGGGISVVHEHARAAH